MSSQRLFGTMTSQKTSYRQRFENSILRAVIKFQVKTTDEVNGDCPPIHSRGHRQQHLLRTIIYAAL